jgi:hypothetical protein
VQPDCFDALQTGKLVLILSDFLVPGFTFVIQSDEISIILFSEKGLLFLMHIFLAVGIRFKCIRLALIKYNNVLGGCCWPQLNLSCQLDCNFGCAKVSLEVLMGVDAYSPSILSAIEQSELCMALVLKIQIAFELQSSSTMHSPEMCHSLHWEKSKYSYVIQYFFYIQGVERI